MAATLETAAIAWIHAGRFPVRNGGVYEHVAHRIFAASDGFVAGGYSGSNRMWTDLLAWMVEEGEAADLVDEKWGDPLVRWQGRPHVDEVVARFVAKRAARAVAEEGRARALPWAEVVPPAQLTENPQLRDRQFFVSVEGAAPGVVEDAGFPWEAPARAASGAAARAARDAGRLGLDAHRAARPPRYDPPADGPSRVSACWT